MDETLNRLADAAGIEPRYWDIHGTEHVTSDETKRILLDAFGLRDVLVQASMLPPVCVLRGSDVCEVPLRLAPDATTLHWWIHLEDGGLRQGDVRLNTLRETGVEGNLRLYQMGLPKLPFGYHTLTVSCGAVEGCCRLIVSPGAGWLPPQFSHRRLTGISTQLYSLRSPGDWGIGDFGHLTRLVETVSGAGCDAIGLNPLHALFLDTPADASPYSPTSRLFRNPFYIDVTAVPEFAGLGELSHDPAVAQGMASANSADVEYPAVAAAKRAALEKMFATFSAETGGARYESFRDFIRAKGSSLTDFTAFQALSEHFGTHDWARWPAPQQDPHGVETRALCEKLSGRMDYFAYLQWLCEEQFARAADVAARRGMAIGLYNDMAVSVNKASADCWCHQDLFAHGLSIGSPPDPFNMAGQEWGVVPMNPAIMRATGYSHFIALLRANMRHAGALRIDHVMGWLRLFLIPAGGKPSDGAYVRYPADDLFAIAALESYRHRCLLIGEDLGTVPDGFRERMASANMLSCRVLYFEREGEGFVPPEHYPELAVASVSTHDLATLRGYFDCVDIFTRGKIGELTGDEVQAACTARGAEKCILMRMLRDRGLLPYGVNADDPGTSWSEPISRAVQVLLARAPSKLMLAQLDDLTLLARQTNLPGTTWQHPNWRTRQPVVVEDLAGCGALDMLRAIIAERARGG